MVFFKSPAMYEKKWEKQGFLQFFINCKEPVYEKSRV